MAQRHPLGGHEILRQQIGFFAPRECARVLDITEKAPGEPDKMGVMPEAQRYVMGGVLSALAVRLALEQRRQA